MRTKIKFGIIGSGYIANEFANAIGESDAVMAAVTSQHRERAEAFAAKHGGMQVFDSWNEMIAWEGIDAVYVATPTYVREEISITAAEKKKHVIAEKPFNGLGSLQRITAACRANGVAFMDGTHFSHHPRTKQLKQELEARIGEIETINSSFFFPSMDRSNIRFNPKKEPTGAIGDMAWYNMRAVAEFADPDAELVKSSGYYLRDDISGAIIRGAGVLLLSDGCTSTWDAGFNVGSIAMELNIYGQRGMISFDDFVLDWAFDFANKVPDYAVGFIQREGNANPSEFKYVPTPSQYNQLTLMINDFAAMTAEPGGEAAEASIGISERTQELLDAVWEQLTEI